MGHDAIIITIIAAAVRAGTPILFAAAGEILAEKAGVLNLGIEGMMLVGALSGFVASQKLCAMEWFVGFFGHNSVMLSLLTGFITAMICSGLLAFVHAFLTITTRANQVVSGLAITLFGTGITGFIGKSFVGVPGKGLAEISMPYLSDIPFLGACFFKQNVLIYLSYLLIPLLWVFIFKTRPGLNLRSIGESPRAADVMGIKVVMLRYVYVVIGGLLAGLAGAYLSLAYTPGWIEDMTGGRGWIAVAIVIFSGWNPLRAAFGAYIFGGISAVQMRIQAAGTVIPANILLMLPYFFTIIVLLLSSMGKQGKINEPPKALGIPYIREER